MGTHRRSAAKCSKLQQDVMPIGPGYILAGEWRSLQPICTARGECRVDDGGAAVDEGVDGGGAGRGSSRAVGDGASAYVYDTLAAGGAATRGVASAHMRAQPWASWPVATREARAGVPAQLACGASPWD